MVSRYNNPFAGNQLVYPEDQREHYQRYCSTGGGRDIDEQPFPRMVDLWFAGLCIAARKGLTAANLTGRITVNMTPGSIFSGEDAWRVQLIRLISLALDNDVEALDRPGGMIAMANGLAAAGVPLIAEMLSDGKQPPIWNLSDAVDELVAQNDKSP